MEYFAQLNITMANYGASADQFKSMCTLIGKLATTSPTRTLQEVTIHTIILMNQNCSKAEAIHKMKYFLRG